MRWEAYQILVSGKLMSADRIYLARISSAKPVAGTHHFVIDDDVDAFTCVPIFALAVVNNGDVNDLQCLRSNARP